MDDSTQVVNQEESLSQLQKRWLDEFIMRLLPEVIFLAHSQPLPKWEELIYPWDGYFNCHITLHDPSKSRRVEIKIVERTGDYSTSQNSYLRKISMLIQSNGNTVVRYSTDAEDNYAIMRGEWAEIVIKNCVKAHEEELRKEREKQSAEEARLAELLLVGNDNI